MNEEASALHVAEELAELQARVAALEEITSMLLAYGMARDPAFAADVHTAAEFAAYVMSRMGGVGEVTSPTHYRYLELRRRLVAEAHERMKLVQPTSSDE